MNKTMNKILIVAIAAALLVARAEAGGTAKPQPQQEFAAALVPAVQTPMSDVTISLARFSLLYGCHQNVYGLDFGVVGNIVTDDFVGFAFSGVFNYVGRSRSSFQLAGLLNRCGEDFAGLQMSLGANYTGQDFAGLQLGCVNIAERMVGMQFAVLNKARRGTGFQLGGVNVAEQFTGVQIGIINLNLDSSVPMSPIFNCYF